MKSEEFPGHSSHPPSAFHFCRSVGSNLMRVKAWAMRASVAAVPPNPSRSQHLSPSVSPQPFAGPLCLPVRPTPSVTLRKCAFVCHFPLLPFGRDDKRRRSSCQPLPHAINWSNKYWLAKKYFWKSIRCGAAFAWRAGVRSAQEYTHNFHVVHRADSWEPTLQEQPFCQWDHEQRCES